MRPQITVIISCFNGEPWLPRCLDSVLAQSVGTQSLRVVIINDGSSDGSAAVIESYRIKYPELLHVVSQENRGIASSRNTGVSLAETKWLAFLDCDDWLDADYFERLLAAGEKANADIVACGYRRTSAEGKVFYTRAAVNTEWHPFAHAEVCAKLHRTDFVKRSGAAFFKNPFTDDILFTFAENAALGVFTAIDYCGYNYLKNPSSITGSISNKAFSEIKLFDVLENLRQTDCGDIGRFNIVVVAAYGLLRSHFKAPFAEFAANTAAASAWLRQNIAGIERNPFLKRRPEGCPLTTWFAAKAFLDAGTKGGWRVRALFALYSAFLKRIIFSK